MSYLSHPQHICYPHLLYPDIQAKFLFANFTVMEAHYKTQHSQEIRVHAFPLYYEINYRYFVVMLMQYIEKCN